MRHGVNWCYKTLLFELRKEGILGSPYLDETEIEQTLNAHGGRGWELVSMLDTRDGVIAVFKRPSFTPDEGGRVQEKTTARPPGWEPGDDHPLQPRQERQAPHEQEAAPQLQVDERPPVQRQWPPAEAEAPHIAMAEPDQDLDPESVACAGQPTGEVQASPQEATAVETMNSVPSEAHGKTTGEPETVRKNTGLEDEAGVTDDDESLGIGAIRIE